MRFQLGTVETTIFVVVEQTVELLHLYEDIHVFKKYTTKLILFFFLALADLILFVWLVLLIFNPILPIPSIMNQS